MQSRNSNVLNLESASLVPHVFTCYLFAKKVVPFAMEKLKIACVMQSMLRWCNFLANDINHTCDHHRPTYFF
jgi:hypothetical protein